MATQRVTKESLREALDRAEKLQLLGLGPFKDAARFVERLLPEVRHRGKLTVHLRCEQCVYDESVCQLWDEGLIEVVTDVIASGYGDTFENTARAVLAVLAQEASQ